MIRVKSNVIEDRIREELDRPSRESIVFDRSVDLSGGVGAQARHLLEHLVETTEHDPEVLEYPLLRTGFDELLVNVLLLPPSNLSDALTAAGRFPVDSRLVRRAEEFIAAHATEPVTFPMLSRNATAAEVPYSAPFASIAVTHPCIFWSSADSGLPARFCNLRLQTSLLHLWLIGADSLISDASLNPTANALVRHLPRLYVKQDRTEQTSALELFLRTRSSLSVPRLIRGQMQIAE